MNVIDKKWIKLLKNQLPKNHLFFLHKRKLVLFEFLTQTMKRNYKQIDRLIDRQMEKYKYRQIDRKYLNY